MNRKERIKQAIERKYLKQISALNTALLLPRPDKFKDIVQEEKKELKKILSNKMLGALHEYTTPQTL